MPVLPKIQSRLDERTQNRLNIAAELNADGLGRRADGDDVEGRNSDLRQRAIEERLAAANLVESDHLAPDGFAMGAERPLGFNFAQGFVERLFALALGTD